MRRPPIDTDDTQSGPPTFQVATASGGYAQLLHQREKAFYEEARDKYLTDFTWTTASDKRSIDRLLLLETQMFRTQDFLARGSDYQGTPFSAVENVDLRRAQKELGAQISALQVELGLTKVQRDKAQDDAGTYLADLRVRAKAFGIMREKQLGRALELMHEAIAMVDAYRRSNAAERAKLGKETADEILEWFHDYIEPEFKKVDDHFRQNDQKFWIRAV